MTTAIGRDAGGAQDRAQVEALAAAVQDATGERAGLAWADQGYTGDGPATVAGLHVLAFAGLLLHEQDGDGSGETLQHS